VTAAIEATGLTKDYGSGRGIFDLDLVVEPGTVFGFLGPNGAGKTTTIRLFMGLIHPTRGSARVFGLDCDRDAVEVKRRVGYVPGELPQWGGLRGSEIVAYLAGPRGAIDERWTGELVDRFGLDLGRTYREYSHGNKQKLALVIAFLHRPELAILDEPTTGLDPLNQQAFYALIREQRAAGATLFLSSHVLAEVEQVCDRVGIVREGRLAAVGTLAELGRLRASHVEVEFGEPVPRELLAAIPGLSDLAVDGHVARFALQGPFDALVVALAGRHVQRVISREPTLEELFLRYYSGTREPPPA